MKLSSQHITTSKTDEKANPFQSILNMEISFKPSFGEKKKERFYADLNVLLNSGIDLKSALEIIIEEQEKPKEKTFYEAIYKNVITGSSFADALKVTGKISDYEYYSILIGEESNRLIEILAELAQFFKERIELRKQVVSVLSYPLFVLAITIGIVYFMLNSVVPMFSDVFKQFGSELPDLTKKIIYISENFSLYSLIFIGTVLIIALLVYYQKDKLWFRKALTSILLKIPIVKGIVSKIYLTRFVQSMHLLLISKTQLVKSLDLTGQMIRFLPMEVAIQDMKTQVTKGASLHSVMRAHSIFPKRLVSLVKVGEEVNRLDVMLAKIAKQYAEELKYETAIIGKIMEPLILLIIGAVVGVILVAMYLPMFNLSNLMAQ